MGAPAFLVVSQLIDLNRHRFVEGMEVAEKIAKDARPVDNNGSVMPDEQPVIESIVITD